MTSLWARKGALAAVSFMLALVAAELGLRLFDYRPMLSSAWILASAERVLDDEVLTVQREFLDDRFYEPFRARDRKVIMVLGDSFTVSFPVARADSFPSVLERILNERSERVRVMNLGMGDTGSDQQFKLMLTHILPRITPDVVVWQFYANDTYDNIIKPLYSLETNALVPLRARDNWMYRRQRFYRSVPWPSVVENSHLFTLLLRSYETDLESQVPEGVDALDWSRRKIAAEIDRMNELARARGFHVYYALVAPEAMYRDDVPDGSTGFNDAAEYVQLRRILERQPTFIDGRFDSSSKEGATGSVLFADGVRDPSPAGARHLNERGYALLAERIAGRLLEDGHLAAPRQPQ
jgi:lysophospholipase L1-like esterase